MPLTNKTVVLDIDETLLCTHDFEGFQLRRLQNLTTEELPVAERLLTVNEERGIFFSAKRPHLEHFLDFCFEYFHKVIIWSAGEFNYVHTMVRKIFPFRQRPHLVLTRDDLPKDTRGEIRQCKPLEIIYRKNKLFKPETTLIVDNLERNFDQNRRNGILIPDFEYDFLDVEQLDDEYLAVLEGWLLQPEVIHTNDVRRLDLSTVFHYSLDDYLDRIGS